MVRGPTKKDKDLLERIRNYETYSDERAVQIWYEVRRQERKRFPKGFLQKSNHRDAILRAFVDEHRKEHPGGYPNVNDFMRNKLYGFLQEYCEGSPFRAFDEAGFTDPRNAVYDSRLEQHPWTVIEKLPQAYWSSLNNRIRGTKFAVRESGKAPTEVTEQDFIAAGLQGLLHETDDSPTRAVIEAGFEIDPVDRNIVPNGTWNDEKNVYKAAQRTSEELGKPVENLTQGDFKRCGYGRVCTVNTMPEIREIIQSQHSV